MSGVFRLSLDGAEAAERALRGAGADPALAVIVVDATTAPADEADFLDAVAEAAPLTIALLRGAPPDFAARLAAAADIAIASENQTFLASENDAPVVAAIGLRQARRFALGREVFSAETARRIGLAQLVAMDAQLEATLQSLLALFAGRAAADLRRAKTALSAPGAH